jgi:cell division protein FtsB
MKQLELWQKIRKVLINKYAITLMVFALLFVFFGDHSLVQYLKRAKKMRALEEQLVQTQQEIEQAESVIRVLDNVDSLERFAREQYRMHAPNEDVYIVE